MGYSTLLDPKSVRVLIGKKRKESVDSLWTVETWQNDLFKVLFNQNRGNPAIDCCAVLRQWPFSRLDKDYISSLIRKEDATIFKRKGILANVNIMKNFEERVPSFQRYFEENMIEKSCSLTPNECFNSLLQERIEFMTKKGIFSDYFKLLCVFVNTATRRPALDIAKLLVPVVSGIQLTNTQKSILTKLISNALLSGWFEAIDIIRSVFDFNEFDLLQFGEDIQWNGDHLYGIRWGMPLHLVRLVVKLIGTDRLIIEFASLCFYIVHHLQGIFPLTRATKFINIAF
eukprot:TRINITY_DN2441_c0_g1_i3.p1 TRINITY_DN2441_c0_g1~~TRINITY_DN2441_c0_g1_i3.p1  ORF type:complete len:286 (+),score=35.18 TRINITY_DN2441_c0_g1_i3:144-1001(+)